VSDYVVIGRLTKTRGRRGELLAEFDSADPERLQRLKHVVLNKDARRETFPIEEIWDHSGRLVVKFEGIDSINDAEPWERAEILVPREEVAPPEAGAYSHQDLVGCTVEQAGMEIGLIQGVEEYGGTPLLQVQAATRLCPAGESREILIPFAKAICKDIDVAGKRIRVELPDGLLDLP
jgi:16S rRNA processing protein RimM